MCVCIRLPVHIAVRRPHCLTPIGRVRAITARTICTRYVPPSFGKSAAATSKVTSRRCALSFSDWLPILVTTNSCCDAAFHPLPPPPAPHFDSTTSNLPPPDRHLTCLHLFPPQFNLRDSVSGAKQLLCLVLSCSLSTDIDSPTIDSIDHRALERSCVVKEKTSSRSAYISLSSPAILAALSLSPTPRVYLLCVCSSVIIIIYHRRQHYHINNVRRCKVHHSRRGDEQYRRIE